MFYDEHVNEWLTVDKLAQVQFWISQLIHLTNLLKYMASVNHLLTGECHNAPSNIHDPCILVGTNVPIKPE